MDKKMSKIEKLVEYLMKENNELKQMIIDVCKNVNNSQIIVEACGGSGNNDIEKEDRIIRKIANNVVIDKTIF